MNEIKLPPDSDRAGCPFTRRHALVGAGIFAAEGLVLLAGLNQESRFPAAEVFVGKADGYTADLDRLIGDGLNALKIGPWWVRGKVIMLKPNLVEPNRAAPHINTHASVVRAAADVFRTWGAREVFVAEGQGHCRDTDYVLEQSGLAPVLEDAGLDFVDLNHDDVITIKNLHKATKMKSLYLPASIRRADLIVSMPKLKTHHWAGVTLAMKNLFGMMPGIVYGWPKNVLHHAGINESILDINAAVKPHLAIIDGIVGMEGDGPIMGTPRHSGVLVMGRNLPAVDATATRLMGIDPYKIPHLLAASRFLGPIQELKILQRGESLSPLVQKYATLDPSRPNGSLRGSTQA